VATWNDSGGPQSRRVEHWANRADPYVMEREAPNSGPTIPSPHEGVPVPSAGVALQDAPTRSSSRRASALEDMCRRLGRLVARLRGCRACFMGVSDWGQGCIRVGVAATVGSLAALLALASCLSPPARALPTRPLALSASAGVGLGPAIARFARVDPSLFAPDPPARSGGRWIHPALRAPRYGHEEFGPDVSTHLLGVPSRMEVALYNSPHNLQVFVPTGEADITLPSELASNASRLQGIAGRAGAAFVVAGVQRDTDALIRALPFGVSVYLLFSSPHAPEPITLEANMNCPSVGFQLYRRLEPGTFSYEEELTNDEEDECEPYSRAPVAPIHPPSPTNTSAAYRAEGSLLATADRQAHRDQAIAALVMRAYPAHDAAGHEVPTEMAWRFGEMAVIRVHLGARHVRFPVLMRLDVITPP
jgi:hypothetical protein